MVDDGRTTDGRTTEHGYTISSPCEPDGSGELKSGVGFKGVYITWTRFPDGIVFSLWITDVPHAASDEY